MRLQVLWRTANSFAFVDPVDGLTSQVSVIPGLEQGIYDRNEIEELMLWQESEAEKYIKAKREDPRKPMTKEFGDALFEVKASNTLQRERGHGKWF